MDQTSRLDGITYCCPQSQQDIAIRNQVGENFISSGMICCFIIVCEDEEGGALFDCCLVPQATPRMKWKNTITE